MATAKAVGYIQQLDEARCAAEWDRVPELIRKVKKHAGHRTCLIETAQAELVVIQSSHHRPSTSARESGLSTLITPLSQNITNNREHAEDEFQAKICLAWIHWILGQPEAAQKALPADIEAEYAQIDGSDQRSTAWTKVSTMKAAYLKTGALLLQGRHAEAYQVCETILPILATLPKHAAMGQELRRWTELYLTEFCLLSARKLQGELSPTTEAEVLTAFRQWSAFWEGSSIADLSGQLPAASVGRRDIWKLYYQTLSKIVQEHLPFPTTSFAVTYTPSSSKLQLHGELRRVETICEGLLLRASSFPRAEESREEVEAWTDQVMRNWRVLCGGVWDESDLEGGREAASRKTLGILFNAATKTFHSTRILRHLFTVHLAVAEFDLAFKAFDTYLDIVTKSKARVDKTGEIDSALDNDETVLLTAVDCIKAMCRYGSRQGAEKAWQLGKYFETWLRKYDPAIRDSKDEEASTKLERKNGSEKQNLDRINPVVAPIVISKTWQAIGISQANWAVASFDVSTRAGFREQAIKSFRHALAPHLDNTKDLETLFPLARVLAEQREIGAAIDVVRAALIPAVATESQQSAMAKIQWTRERALIPIWHLLALLVSAKHEFAVAARSCEGAFEQFKDPRVLFGDTVSQFQSDHLNEKETASGVVDIMSDHERESILEIKMTQLVLSEVIDGPEEAVNSSEELLGLYTRLFGDPAKSFSQANDQAAKSRLPPKSSAGTVKSIKGSIFGRSGRPARKVSKRATSNPVAARSQTRDSPARAPTIQVTNANGEADRATIRSRHHGSLSIRGKSTSRSAVDTSGTTDMATADSPLVAEEKEIATHALESAVRRSQVGLAISPEADEAVEDASADQPHGAISDLPLDALHQHIYHPWEKPIPQFSPAQRRRRRLGILIRVWLLIAAFYRRAQLYDDAQGALEEAQKVVEGLERDVARDASNSDALKNSGWGGGVSVEQLWADVATEQGYLELEKGDKHRAVEKFETALVHWHDHPSATVGLSNLLLDAYTGDLLPPPNLPSLVLPKAPSGSSAPIITAEAPARTTVDSSAHAPQPLGISRSESLYETVQVTPTSNDKQQSSGNSHSPSPTQLGRLAARDRAFGLLSHLTTLGTGWNYSEAWFALARAYEESGQLDKAREALWWCVELEDNKGVRPWDSVGVAGYVL